MSGQGRNRWVCGLLGAVVVSCFCLTAGARTVRHKPQTPKVLNNFVTELIRMEDVSRRGTHVVAFENGREGWILFRPTAWVGRKGRMTITVVPTFQTELAKSERIVEYAAGDKKTVEIMRYLPKGTYEVRTELRGAELNSLSVRTLPAIIFANFPYAPHLPRYGRYDWAWLRQIGMLDSCNVIITGGQGGHFMKEWLAQGRQVLQQAGVPGLHPAGPFTVQGAYEYWTSTRGMNDPAMSGIIADEFYPSKRLVKYFPTWIPAIKRVRETRPDKVFYPYIAGSADGLRPFVEPLLGTDCRFAYERYLNERPTEAEAAKFIKEALVDEMAAFNKYAPGFAARCIYVLGFLAGPNESVNKYPHVNFKVFMDMQFYVLATDAAFGELYGVEEYLSAYCDEEYLRWCAKLFRHYCIEGNAERLTADPYILQHIQNPDFEDGLKGWKSETAKAGSIQVKTMKDYGWLQGRYPKDATGDIFLSMTRDENKANVVSQTIRNLEPGRFYSVKMYTGDYGDLTKWQKHQVALRVDGADRVTEEDYQGAFHNCYSHLIKEKFGETKTFFNYHRLVFQATSDTAQLSISDWRNVKAPGGPIGQETMFNFIEVEPYLMPNAYAR